jgi:RNA polymerase sigma-70 factor (ECF subfamily)
MLRSRRSRREEPLAPDDGLLPDAADPEHEAVLADSVGLAMQTVLQRLGPAERVAFVLHDVFGLSFEEIAGIVDRSPAATRQLASRGRRRVQGTSDEGRAEDLVRHRDLVEAFFKASRDGNFEALLAVLDPDVALRLDGAALHMGQRTGWLTSELVGAAAVAQQFNGAAQAAQIALLDGVPGGVWIGGGRPVVAFAFTTRGGKVAEIELIADAERLNQMSIEVLD